MIERVYQFYSDGFFGYGERGDFVPWSLWHILPLCVIAAAIFLTWRYREELSRWKWEARLRFIFAFVMMIAEMSYFWRTLYVGEEWGASNLLGKLPLQVCQWGLICAMYALMSLNDELFGVNFFVTICLTMPALFIPSVLIFTGPGYYRYYQYWMEHGMPLIAVFYLMFVKGKRPVYRHLWLSVGLLTLLSIPSLIANRCIPGANYMYLGNFMDGAEAALDPLSFLPRSQALRLGIMAVLVIAVFHLLYALEKRIERRCQKEKD